VRPRQCANLGDSDVRIGEQSLRELQGHPLSSGVENIDRSATLAIWLAMRAPAARRLLVVLNILALALFGMTMAGGMSPAVAAGMVGDCAHHCQRNPSAGHDTDGMPGCDVLSCTTNVTVAPTQTADRPALVASTAVYYGRPSTRLSGLAPGTDPPPPRSFSAC
jgi:hypothetical protein